MNYDDLVRIAIVAKRWEANSDPEMNYIRQLTRHSYLGSGYEYWAERGHPQAAQHYASRIDQSFAVEHYNASGRAKAY